MAEEASMTRRKGKLLGWSEEGALKRNRAYSLLRMGPWVSLSSPVPRKVTGRGDLEARSSRHWTCALEEAVGTSPILSHACWSRVSASAVLHSRLWCVVSLQIPKQCGQSIMGWYPKSVGQSKPFLFCKLVISSICYCDRKLTQKSRKFPCKF